MGELMSGQRGLVPSNFVEKVADESEMNLMVNGTGEENGKAFISAHTSAFNSRFPPSLYKRRHWELILECMTRCARHARKKKKERESFFAIACRAHKLQRALPITPAVQATFTSPL